MAAECHGKVGERLASHVDRWNPSEFCGFARARRAAKCEAQNYFAGGPQCPPNVMATIAARVHGLVCERFLRLGMRCRVPVAVRRDA